MTTEAGMVVIETPRLRLRTWCDEDLDPFAALNADPCVMRHYPAVLDRGESDAIAGRIRARMAEQGIGRDLSAARRGGTAASVVGDAIFILGDPAAFDDAFLRLLDAPGVVGPVRGALGTTALAAHFMNVTIKHPRWGRALGWHRDYPNGYACPAASRFVRVMLCLDGMDEASGATTFVPGSHRIDDVAARSEAGARAPPSPGDVVAVRCAPGDLVLIHPKVLHGGGMNTSERPRRNVVLQAGDATAPLLDPPKGEVITGRIMGVSPAAD